MKKSMVFDRVGWSSRVEDWDSMEVLIFLPDTHLHKRLTQLILALNSFWLVRNPVRHFGTCNYSHQLTCFNFSECLWLIGKGKSIKWFKWSKHRQKSRQVIQRAECRTGFLAYWKVKWAEFWVLNSSRPLESGKTIRSEKKFWNSRDIGM